LLHGYDSNQAFDVEYGRPEKVVRDIGTYGTILTHMIRKARMEAQEMLREERKKAKRRYDRGKRDANFVEGSLVLLWRPVVPKGLRKKLYVKYAGPLRVKERCGSLNYVIVDMKTGKEQRVHVNRLRAFDPWLLDRQEEAGNAEYEAFEGLEGEEGQ